MTSKGKMAMNIGEEQEKEVAPFIPKWNLTVNHSVIEDGKVARQLVEGANLPVDVNHFSEMSEKEFEYTYFSSLAQVLTTSSLLWLKHERLWSAHMEASKESSEAMKKICEEQSKLVLDAEAKEEKWRAALSKDRNDRKTYMGLYIKANIKVQKAEEDLNKVQSDLVKAHVDVASARADTVLARAKEGKKFASEVVEKAIAKFTSSEGGKLFALEFSKVALVQILGWIREFVHSKAPHFDFSECEHMVAVFPELGKKKIGGPAVTASTPESTSAQPTEEPLNVVTLALKAPPSTETSQDPSKPPQNLPRKS
ncbi:hypothetical protein NE237_007724 [Protea cynaroides]|uniref:Uncharacterized protein n=1 Tax=Protea cynaroides TaxID=273540 RepID=A0A9Q0QWR1_9MAGN|nr:hypothetical protein NE237_007724 [Protea cynaroides]